MGGKNHQPCGRYVDISLKLSLHLSRARAHLELGNAELEELLLDELRKIPGSLKPILRELESSADFLKRSLEDCSQMRQRIENNDFVDLPTLKKMGLADLGNRLTENRIVANDAWSIVTRVMTTEGFRGMLEMFEISVSELSQLTSELAQRIEQLQEAVSAGEVLVVLEQNREY